MSDAESAFVTCLCNLCSGKIEFEQAAFDPNTPCPVICPHCGLETYLYIPQAPKAIPTPAAPPPPAKPPVIPEAPIWFGGPDSLVEIWLTSGSSLKIKAVRLYHESVLRDLAVNRGAAMEMLEGVRSPYIPFGSIMWVTAAMMLNRAVEANESEKAAQRGVALLQEVIPVERKLRDNAPWFPVGQIQDIGHPFPTLWRVPWKSAGYVHDGSEFVSVTDSDGLVCSVRWSALERYNYQPNLQPLGA